MRNVKVPEASKTRKKSCVMYAEWLDLLKDEDLCLSDAEIGVVMIAVLEYIKNGELPKFSDRGLMAVFKSIKGQIDKDGEKYDETCKKRRESSAKRWNKSTEENANACKCMQGDANGYDNECDNDNGHNSLKESMCVDTRTREDKKSAVPCGLFGNVYLTGEEIKALDAEIGEKKLKKAIMKLSTEIEKTGKYKNEKHAATIRSWVLEAIDEAEIRELERNSRRKRASAVRDEPNEKAEMAKKAGFDFDFEEIYEKP